MSMRGYCRVGLYRYVAANELENFCDLHFRYRSDLRNGTPVWFGADDRSINQINRSHRRFWAEHGKDWDLYAITGEAKAGVDLNVGGVGLLEHAGATWVCTLHGPILFDSALYGNLEVRLYGHLVAQGLQDAAIFAFPVNSEDGHGFPVLPYGAVKWHVEETHKRISRRRANRLHG